jgi:hypothetical protein
VGHQRDRPIGDHVVCDQVPMIKLIQNRAITTPSMGTFLSRMSRT